MRNQRGEESFIGRFNQQAIEQATVQLDTVVKDFSDINFADIDLKPEQIHHNEYQSSIANEGRDPDKNVFWDIKQQQWD